MTGLDASASGLLALWLLVVSSACTRDPLSEEVNSGAQVAAPADATVPERDAGAPMMPSPRAGADLIGRNLSELLPARFVGQSVDLSSNDATLIRFWTDSCPFCATSLPAIEALRERYEAKGLATIGVYHPKPPRSVSNSDVSTAAVRMGYRGPVAIDEDWKSLRSIWLETGQREATSFSALCDRRGVVRFVHPGPELRLSEEPAHTLSERDFADLEAAIQALLDA